MALRKTAIALSDDLLNAVDRAARRRRESRNRFVTRVLECAVRAQRDAEVTRRLDELFADPGLQEEQRSAVSDLNAVGTRWDDERW